MRFTSKSVDDDVDGAQLKWIPNNKIGRQKRVVETKQFHIMMIKCSAQSLQMI